MRYRRRPCGVCSPRRPTRDMQHRTSSSVLTVAAVLGLAAGACRTPSSVPTTSVDSPSSRIPSSNAPQTGNEDNVKANANPNAQNDRYPKPPTDELRRKLTPIQFQVTQNDATEPPFHNEFWDNHAAGIYVDVATGEPLFSSLDKFESG